ncbi:MAG: DotA/TraY family protein [Alphaproteobacteria bacterium]|nr:DotA/TraY family protein [Alphaproteobacteria bacterium]
MLPGVIPRVKAFAADGFTWLAALMAAIYAGVGLLPYNHPYLNAENKGRFGMRHVILEAGRRLKFDRNHIDQVIIYFTLLLGFVLLLAQIALLAVGLVLNPVFAGPPFLGLFATPLPDEDIAYMLLDRVFAVPGLYGSQWDPALIGMTPFSDGLHSLFQFYSQAMLIVAIFIVLYYVVILVAETAQTGTPFGKRFDTIWAPIRLVVAIGLLVPINWGYNSAQYLVLFAAKYGSSFATNAWNIYNDTVAASAMGCALGANDNAVGWCDSSLISIPRLPDPQHLIQFMSLARSCKLAYETTYRAASGPAFEIKPYLVKKTATGQVATEITYAGWVAGLATALDDWIDAVDFYNYADILIVFGQENAAHTQFTGNVKPFCGEIVLATSSVKTDLLAAAQDMAVVTQSLYLLSVKHMWFGDNDFEEFARKANSKFIDKYIREYGGPCVAYNQVSFGDVGACEATAATADNPATTAGLSTELPGSEWGHMQINHYTGLLDLAITAVRAGAIVATDFTVTTDMEKRGWAGAGIWYNKIAEWNGAFFSAVINIPTPKSMPLVMKEVEAQKSGTDQNINAVDRYDPNLASKDRENMVNLTPDDKPIAEMLSHIFKYWRGKNNTETVEMKSSGNAIFDVLSAIFGLNGLFTIRETSEIHPMAQLSGIGRSIVESAIRNLMVAMGFSFLGGMTEIIDRQLGGAMTAISSMFVTFTTMGLTVGFILYYVLPFLPFMYFFFAVGSWLKSIFEAMVGVPLWALAHLRIDGHGLHGDTALNGYFLIFEIFIRPILTVFGLLASMAIFAAMVRTLNGIFPMVTANLTGFDPNSPKVAGKILGIEFKRSIIDEFFFTLIYTIIVYMIALSSFKMIDMVPNHIMRWMGSGAQSFSESAEGSMNQFISYAAIGGSQLTKQATGAMVSGARLGGNVMGMPFGLLSRAGGGGAAGGSARGAPSRGGGNEGGGGGGGQGRSGDAGGTPTE